MPRGPFRLESELYDPVKRFLEGQGYTAERMK
jgi:hypothetical protein